MCGVFASIHTDCCQLSTVFLRPLPSLSRRGMSQDARFELELHQRSREFSKAKSLRLQKAMTSLEQEVSSLKLPILAATSENSTVPATPNGSSMGTLRYDTLCGTIRRRGGGVSIQRMGMAWALRQGVLGFMLVLFVAVTQDVCLVGLSLV